MLVNHVMDALSHGTVPLLPPLGLLIPLVPQLGAQRLALATVLHHLLISKVLLLIRFEVLLDIRRNFGQVL